MIMYVISPIIFMMLSTTMYLSFMSSFNSTTLILLLTISAALGFHAYALIFKMQALIKKQKSLFSVIGTNLRLIVIPILWLICTILLGIGMAGYYKLFILAYVIMISVAICYLISIEMKRKSRQ